MLLFADPCAQFYSSTAQGISGLWQSLSAATVHTSGLPAGNIGPAAFSINSRGSQIAVPAASGPYILGFRWCSTSAYSGGNEIAAFTDSNSSTQISFVVNIGGTMSAKLNNGTVLGTTTTPLVANVWAYIEFLVTCNNAAGAIGIHINGNPELTLSGINTQSQGTNLIQTIFLGAAGFSNFIQDVYVVNSAGARNNTYLGDVHASVYNAASNGTFTAYTPNGAATIWQSVSATTPTDSTIFASDGTPGDRMSVHPASTAVTGTIVAVVNVARLAKSDAGARTAALTITNGAGDITGSTINLGTSYGYYTQIQEVDPATGSPWLNSGFNTTQIGVTTVS
jgi:hypothetical protein